MDTLGLVFELYSKKYKEAEETFQNWEREENAKAEENIIEIEIVNLNGAIIEK